MARATFEESKDIVLRAAHETLYCFADYESYSAEDIHDRVKDIFFVGYTKRILSSLVSHELIKADAYDEMSAPHYALTDKGLEVAEELPSLYSLTARFLRSAEDAASSEIPAADRLVRLNHNQVGEWESSIAGVIEALEQDNGDPEQPGFRERLLGQIKAGRELIRSGEFRAYLLYETLVRALGELISRYKNPTIAALANALLGAIVGQMLQGL